MKELRVLFPRQCPHCSSPSGRSFCDYACPVCRYVFCSKCYKTYPKGDGSYVSCPACDEKLKFPPLPQCDPEFVVGDVCIFTNKSSSGITSNNGRECKIVRIKEKEMLVNPNVPEYAIRFDEDHGFGASERELKLKIKN